MQIRVRIPAALREHVDGASTVEMQLDDEGETTVGAVLDAMAVLHPVLERRVRDERGRTRPHVNLFVGEDNVRSREGLATPIATGEDLSIIPAISGG